ncbi:NAD(P)/FAD-dependent oxidoreductase [Actinomadura sp. 7K507]|uniref:flavin-containing monooxygenase n=1 Tax=Actinomadura sp. 7K507 TaxID=2530365 RepID=UPI0010520046|nr:NAD(P)/FAD-dependent oxidoreductase [Actinomadura sp. 7K507]TDC85727.1 NAD(P)/FAD-dependent oxidoreductase [Actinomadura sp. 7K507]
MDQDAADRATAPSPDDAEWSDERLRNAVATADLPALLAALAQILDDDAFIDPALRPDSVIPPAGALYQGGLDEERQRRARGLCLDGLRRLRDSGVAAAPEPTPARLSRLLDFIAHGADESYLPLLAHELDLPRDGAAPAWKLKDLDPERDFRVAVIGAGLSGLVAAHRLKQAGVDVVVFDKNPDVGGTWYENTYPGCRLDTHNYAYSYSFAQKPDWPCYFSSRESIQDYFVKFAEDAGLAPHLRLSTHIVALDFQEPAANWNVRHRAADGTETTEVFDAVVSAVGQLNQPLVPEFPGRERFQGETWHTARWRHDVDLTGLRVGVVGTGASGFQVVPAIAEQVEHLTVFQRNPPWTLPTPRYMDEIEEELLWLFRNVPYYARWYRFLQFWTSVEGRRRFVEVDPDWTKEGSVSEANEVLRVALTDHLTAQFADRPDLLPHVVPAYPPGAKRLLRDNGSWARTLKRDDVALVTDRISEFTEDGIRTADGALHELDAVIYSTGFTASEFLSTMRVTGTGKRDLHEFWDGDARAYLGITVPHFPNLFCVYGPNTNLVVNGSTVLFTELAVEYIVKAVESLVRDGDAALDCREDAYLGYNDAVDAENKRMAWGAAEVSSWYKNSKGRVSQCWPFPLLDYWTSTRTLTPEAYRRIPRT